MLSDLKKRLESYDRIKVDVFCKYVNFLQTDKKDGKLRNPWASHLKAEQLAHQFEKVRSLKLWFDGESVTLQFGGKISFGYQAYKNLVLIKYPESIFDMQLVKDGDVFSFNKESGKVIYSHKINSPFENPTEKNIVGAYCIIKNKNGEFIESMGLEELRKCKQVSKMKYIWDAWFGEMCFKSVLKRSCKRHFNDITVDVDKLDNDNYDLSLLEDKKDTPLELFKKLTKDRPDFDEILELFNKLNSTEEKRKYYSQIKEEIKKENNSDNS